MTATSTMYSVSGAQALEVIDLLRGWGHSLRDVLAARGFSEEKLEEPGVRVPIDLQCALLARARELSGEPALGVFLGLRRRVSTYGFLGIAAMHARTLRQALELMVEFAPTVSNVLTVRFEVDAGLASLQLIENVELGSVRDIVLTSMSIGLAQLGNALTGQVLRGHIEMPLPRPVYFERFADVLAHVRYGQPDARIVFDAKLLDLPVIAADRATLRLARQQCEQLLAELQPGASFVDCVRRLITEAPGFRSLDQVAARLNLSTRTLRRKLAGHGVGFSELIDEERRKRAMFLLRTSELGLKTICEQIGYATLPNFVRAFKRWTGQTPASYRRSARAALALQPMAAIAQPPAE